MSTLINSIEGFALEGKTYYVIGKRIRQCSVLLPMHQLHSANFVLQKKFDESLQRIDPFLRAAQG